MKNHAFLHKSSIICLDGVVTRKFIRYTWVDFALKESNFKKADSRRKQFAWKIKLCNQLLV